MTVIFFSLLQNPIFVCFERVFYKLAAVWANVTHLIGFLECFSLDPLNAINGRSSFFMSLFIQSKKCRRQRNPRGPEFDIKSFRNMERVGFHSFLRRFYQNLTILSESRETVFVSRGAYGGTREPVSIQDSTSEFSSIFNQILI